MEDEKQKAVSEISLPTEGGAAGGKSSNNGSGDKNNYCPYITNTNGKASNPTKSTHDSRSNMTNTLSHSGNSGGLRGNSSCTSVSSSSSGGVTSLSSGGLGNPFARQATQPTWGTEADSKRILAPSRLGSHSDTGNSTKPSLLRPSTMGSGGSSFAPTRPSSASFFNTSANSQGATTNKSMFKLKPSVLGGSNPFAKAPVDNEDESASTASSTASAEPSAATSVTSDLETKNKPLENDSVNTTNNFGSSLSPSDSNKLDSSPSRNVFMPLARNGEESSEERLKSPRARDQVNTGSGFVFGSNIEDKVTGAEINAASPEAATNGENSTGNLFSDAAKANSNDISEDGVWGGGKSLVESSRELSERENANKRKFDEVEVITGEEAESNVLQMNCKLYAWTNGTWQERGRGLLRLNDWDAQGELHSRLVIRTQGTLTVMLNTKVWSEMSVERASPKSVRFTSLETDGQPKIFLVMGSPKDIDLLYNSLEWRVATSRSHVQDDTDPKKTKLDEEVPPLNV
ncbi:unnamed protein product [Meganyctiphanes norvegica]|uniref:RanBD1 domain-containing protein n=1 Tax=Meganyctiphanes norvegica TaxID=48144 RepID=A0AAV2PRU8_MEGNR